MTSNDVQTKFCADTIKKQMIRTGEANILRSIGKLR